jgi:ATP-dependent DNA ligase
MPAAISGLQVSFAILAPVPLPLFQPMPLGRKHRPFNHPDWLFEIKWDGFRSLVRIEHGSCRLISRNGNEFKSFPALNSALPNELKAQAAVLDGGSVAAIPILSSGKAALWRVKTSTPSSCSCEAQRDSGGQRYA